MKMNRECKVEECVSTDPSRKVLQHVWLEGDKLIACDGRMLVVVPVEREEGDTDGFVSVEAIKAARKKPNLAADGRVQITANCSLQLPNGSSFLRPKKEDIGQYPSWVQVLPDKEREVKYTIGFNAELLVKLQRAMGAEFVRLEFSDNCSSIRVLPKGGKSEAGASGVLMPARLS